MEKHLADLLFPYPWQPIGMKPYRWIFTNQNLLCGFFISQTCSQGIGQELLSEPKVKQKLQRNLLSIGLVFLAHLRNCSVIMEEMFGIEILSTAAYSPWSNGICESHNLTLSETVKKIKADRNCSWDTALCWALMDKNSMCNVNGFSPHQLVFGTNPNLPSVISDKLPALEGKSTSQHVAEHMSSLFAARKAYTEAECSERIRRALRKQRRTHGRNVLEWR